MKGTCAGPRPAAWVGAAVVVQGGRARHQEAGHHQQQLPGPRAGEAQRPARARHGRPQRGGAALPADRQLPRPGRGGGAGRGVRQQVGGGDQEAAALLALALRLHPPHRFLAQAGAGFVAGSSGGVDHRLYGDLGTELVIY